MKEKYKKLFMDFALRTAKLSYAQRKKVGAIAVTPNDILLYSYNGTAIGDNNCCEIDPDTTKPEVLHAELNIISKSAREGISLKGSTMFVTLSPCLECSKAIAQSGIEKVYYFEEYRLTTGIDYLDRRNVETRFWFDVFNQYQKIEIEIMELRKKLYKKVIVPLNIMYNKDINQWEVFCYDCYNRILTNVEMSSIINYDLGQIMQAVERNTS